MNFTIDEFGKGTPESMAGRGTVAVIIPALNEEAALPSVLRALPSESVTHLVVVDNGSEDRTVDVAREHGARVVHETERGYGAACLAGIAYLAELEPPPDVVAFIDADHSDDPSQLGRLVDPVLEGSADLVLGVRHGEEEGRTVLLHARLGNWLVLSLSRLLFGVRFVDLPPFRAISFNKLLELEMDDRNWGWTLQMQLRAWKKRLSVSEIPMPHQRRVAGKSKISGTVSGTVRVGAKMMYTIVRERLRS